MPSIYANINSQWVDLKDVMGLSNINSLSTLWNNWQSGSIKMPIGTIYMNYSLSTKSTASSFTTPASPANLFGNTWTSQFKLISQVTIDNVLYSWPSTLISWSSSRATLPIDSRWYNEDLTYIIWSSPTQSINILSYIANTGYYKYILRMPFYKLLKVINFTIDLVVMSKLMVILLFQQILTLLHGVLDLEVLLAH